MTELAIKILNVIAPIFILMVVGGVVYYRKIVNSVVIEQLNNFVYKVSMPIMLFYFMAKTESELIDYNYILLTLIYCFIVAGLAMLLNNKLFVKSNRENALATLAMAFSNTAYIGLPLTFFAFGEEGMPPAIIVCTLFMILFVSFTLILGNVDKFANSRKNKFLFILDIFKRLLFAPMIFMSIFGLVWAIFEIAIPQVIDISLGLIANANIGLALIVIGMTLMRIFIAGEILLNLEFVFRLLMANIYKLVVAPLLAFLIIYPFDIDIIWKSVFILQAALSTGLISYIMSSNMKVYERESALIIFSTTIMSLVTLPIVLGMLYNWS